MLRNNFSLDRAVGWRNITQPPAQDYNNKGIQAAKTYK